MKKSLFSLRGTKKNVSLCFYRTACILIFLSLTAGRAFGQLNADFEADTTSGCSHVNVQFHDLSTGNPSGWQWDFGNGNTSKLQNPAATYTSPGTYTVTLVVTDGITSDQAIRQSYITVSDTPSVSFLNDPVAGCYPLTVNFKDGSTAGSGTITNWLWDFGNGATSTEPNPSYEYTDAGSFNVTLSVTNSAGCVKAFTKTPAVVTNEGVTVDFSADRTFSCGAPLDVQFTAEASSTNPVTYQWDFGDGSTGSGKTPAHTYSQNGAYTVSVVAFIGSGCPDTVIKKDYIHIGDFKTDFELPQGCAKVPLSFKNTSEPIPASAVWDFGDGSAPVSAIDANHTYAASGTYTVTLTNSYGGCTQSIQKEITTYPLPTADFKTDKQIYCEKPAAVSFQDISQGATSWLWYFGDGTTSALQNPVHKYTKSGSYDVSLVVTNANGCRDSTAKIKYIQVNAPDVQFQASVASGCVPLIVNFQNQVQSVDPIASYEWDFGDGTTSTASDPSHTYADTGTYTVTLRVTTASGCTGTLVRTNFIRSGSKSTVQFAADPTTTCLETPIQFTNQSSPPGDSWQWEFPNDGDSIEYTENPLHLFHHLGKQTVILSVNNNGCISSLTKQDYVTIKVPKAKFDKKQDCATPFAVTVTDQSNQAATWHWSFGDGTTAEGKIQAPHVYNKPGDYRIILTVTNGNCSSSDTDWIHIIGKHDPVLALSSGTACHGDSITLSDSNADGIVINRYTWTTGDGKTFTTKVPLQKVAYTNNGQYDVKLTTTDRNGCVASTSATKITVQGPDSKFEVSSPTACPGTQLSFADESTTQGAAIRQWEWDFGDGTSDVASGASVTHNYLQGGKRYDVNLKVTDENGCSDDTTRSQVVSIYAAKADFSTPDTLTCLDTPLRWLNQSQGAISHYLWNFGDGSSSTEIVPVKSYPRDSIYTVSLRIETQDGCIDSMVKTDYITAGNPQAEWAFSDSGTVKCPPYIVAMINKSKNYKKIRWDFGDGTTSTLDTAKHIYNIPGNYKLTLQAFGYSDGCVDIKDTTIAINGPYGEPFINDSSGCSPLPVHFSAQAVRAVSYQWDFGDGNFSQVSTDDNADHVYANEGISSPKLILTDAQGCQVVIPAKEKVTVDSIGAKTPLYSMPEICDSNTVRFENQSTIFSFDSLGLQAMYSWNFGDPTSAADTSHLSKPVYRYPTAGNYQATLKIETAYGCTLTSAVAVPVPDSVALEISASPDATICEGESVQLQATGGDHYAWLPVQGLDDPAIASPSATPDTTVTYQVVGYNKGNCQSDTADVNILVHPKPDVSAGDDQMVATGSVVQLQATGGTGVVQWNWTPPDYLSCIHCADPASTPRKSMIYTVTGTDGFGCADTADVKITLVCSHGNVFIPNTFSPNDDGVNDVFYPRGRGVRNIIYLRIFNRWGQLVFEHNNFSLNDKPSGWKGTFKGARLPPGVYIYQTSMVCDDEKIFELKGNITLLR